ncbi:MAG: 30S ribosomal protein S16 [Candidatus Delongbacteria bacterium]|nr:30S ribosomal protein S16 [Candidatus Delongbacteria bacterium]
MSVTLRMTRMGRRKRPFYRIVAIDSRKRRDGRYIESIGFYDPMPNPSLVKVEEELALKWLRVGATLSPAVRNLLKQTGVLLKFALEKANADDERKAAIIAEWDEANQKRLKKIQDEAAEKQAKLEKAAEKAAKADAPAEVDAVTAPEPEPKPEPEPEPEPEPKPEAETEEPEKAADVEPVAEPEKAVEADAEADSSKEAAE